MRFLSKQYVPNVVMTVVEKVMPEEKIQKCQEICDTLELLYVSARLEIESAPQSFACV